MPPQATGFRYTPSSYLLRKRDENRPWEGSSSSLEAGADSSSLDELDMAMKQEDRPVRKGTSIDQHFQNRVNRRKQAYRKIIQGQVEILDDEKPVDTEDVDLHLSSQASAEGGPAPPTAAMAAREARQRRLSASTPTAIAAGETSTILSKQQAEKSRVRNLRAQRIRHSLKTTTEEEDAMEALKIRRQKQAERDRIAARQEEEARKLEDEQQQEADHQRKALEEERRTLEQERQEFEAAKRWAAIELERRQELERKQLLATSESSASSASSRQKGLRVSRAEPELIETSLLEDFGDMFRDLGVLKVCAASCFGDEDSLEEDGDELLVKGSYRRKSNEEF
jgi:hypothetical protein